VFRLPCTPLRLQLVLLAMSLSPALAATPFSSATVTRVENKVSVGQVQNGRNVQRPASVADVVGARDYVLTDAESRAELQFPDKSLVRVGQNTVFSFDSASRTLSLEKGAMLFYVPPNSGGGNIKTPTLTAAITGTVGKVSENTIAVLSGELRTKYGVIHRGEAIEVIGGQVRIFKFDPKQAPVGKLFWFGGPPPEIPEVGYTNINSAFTVPDLHVFDVLEDTQVNPRVAARVRERLRVPRPKGLPPVENPPY
jgi:FecR protein